MLELERTLKDMVQRRKDRHELGRTFLVNVLAKGDHGGSRRTGRISVDKFIKVLQRGLRFPLIPSEAKAIFRKYGHDAKGLMPYELFARRLFENAAHVAALEGSRSQPFRKDQPAHWAHQGMIKARPNKRGVYAPSDWKDECEEKCRASACKPDAYLKLEHVYGYSGLKNTAPNLFYTKRGAVVYYTAAVGIVYEKETNTQKFFLRHDDDVQCLTIHKDRDTVATGQVGAEPVVYIWSAEGVTDRDKDPGPEGREEPIDIRLPYGQRAVQCMGFSQTGTGDFLATVSTDNEHTINIWNWRDCRQDGVDIPLATAIGKQGTPPQVYCLEWNPYAGTPTGHFSDFVTGGVNHITFWTHDGASGLEQQGGAFGSTTQQDVLHVAYLATVPRVVAGGPNGNITIYEDKLAVAEITDAHASWCRAFCMRNDGNSILSAGGDGKVITWTINAEGNNVLEKAPKQSPPLKEEDGDAPALLAVDADPNDESTFIAGSQANDIWEVDDDPRQLVEGQSALVFGIAPNPNPEYSFTYASGCADGAVYIWNANTRQCLKSFKIKRGSEQKPVGCEIGDLLKVKAVQFSSKGDLFVLSTAGVVAPPQENGANEEFDHPDKGGVIQVFETSHEMFLDDAEMEDGFDEVKFVKKYRRWEMKDTNEEIDDLKFSPSGRYLAAASHDNVIYVYDVKLSFDVRRGGAMVKTGKCVGHSSFVKHIDWSVEGDMLMSNSGDYEQLYWDVNCKQVMTDVRDKKWDTWTCTLGFEVMGIWQDGMDGTDINALHRSHNGNFSVMSGDDGLVYLFNHPVVIDEAPHRAFRGHSSHVENVRFLADDRRVVSAGGADRSMMQWRTHGIIAPSSHFKKNKLMAKRQVPPPLGGGGGADASPEQPVNAPSLEIKLAELKAEYKMNNDTLKQKDREILYLKQQLALKSAGIKTAARGSGKVSSSYRPVEPIIVSKDRLEREYKKVARKGKLRVSEFKAFLTNIGFEKSQEVAQRLFNAFDLNRDGELQAEEFITGLTLMTGEDSDRKLEFIFRMLDKDGSGGISELEIRTFMKNFFVLGVDAVSIILRAIEGLVGTTGARDYRSNLVDQADDLVRNKVERMMEKAIIMADSNPDGRIGFDEFRQWIYADPQLLQWVHSLGSYWAGLSQEANNGNMDPRHIRGKGDAERKVNAVKVKEYLEAHMGRIKLEGEGSLVAALEKFEVDQQKFEVDEQGCVELFAAIGCYNAMFAKKVHQIYAGEGKSDGKNLVKVRAILCGVSLLCAPGATAAQKLAFSFSIFDSDRSGDLEISDSKNEVREFFELLRGPATKSIDDAMQTFFDTCVVDCPSLSLCAPVLPAFVLLYNGCVANGSRCNCHLFA